MQVAVAELGALGLAGGARRVEDDRGVFRCALGILAILLLPGQQRLELAGCDEDALRARLRRSVLGGLGDITLLLSSDGYDDLTTRSDYLQALHNADNRVADRVAALRDQVAGHVHEVADLKQQVDAQAQQLSSARASLVASQAAAKGRFT